MKNIGVLANCHKPDAPRVLRQVGEIASARDMALFVTCKEEQELLPAAAVVAPDELRGQVEVLLALGGDGTVLHAARMLAGTDIPILGVNLGSLGFLTSVTQQEIEKAIEVLETNDFFTTARSIAECRVFRGEKELGTFRALNDIVVAWGESSRVITLDVQMDGEQVASFNCDGMIASTPTGSTGHSLSAGGPILHPASPCFVITAICPHTLSNRPLVVSDQSAITVKVSRAQKRLLLSVDGQEELSVEEGDRMEIRKAERGVSFLHLPGYSYFSVLRKKLLWSGSSIAEG